MVDETALSKLQQEIVRMVRSEEDVCAIVSRLTETDWAEVFRHDREKRKGLCKGCYKYVPYYSLVEVPSHSQHLFCPSCYTVCPSCKDPHVHGIWWISPLCKGCIEAIGDIKVEQERLKLIKQLSRAKRRGVPADLTLGQWITNLIKFSWMCAYCQSNQYEQVDHFLPIRHGGGTTWSNCVPSCKKCNFLKGQYHPSKITKLPHEDVLRVQQYLNQIQ